jgi:hypothetical protein
MKTPPATLKLRAAISAANLAGIDEALAEGARIQSLHDINPLDLALRTPLDVRYRLSRRLLDAGARPSVAYIDNDLSVMPDTALARWAQVASVPEIDGWLTSFPEEARAGYLLHTVRGLVPVVRKNKQSFPGAEAVLDAWRRMEETKPFVHERQLWRAARDAAAAGWISALDVLALYLPSVSSSPYGWAQLGGVAILAKQPAERCKNVLEWLVRRGVNPHSPLGPEFDARPPHDPTKGHQDNGVTWMTMAMQANQRPIVQHLLAGLGENTWLDALGDAVTFRRRQPFLDVLKSRHALYADNARRHSWKGKSDSRWSLLDRVMKLPPPAVAPWVNLLVQRQLCHNPGRIKALHVLIGRDWMDDHRPVSLLPMVKALDPGFDWNDASTRNEQGETLLEVLQARVRQSGIIHPDLPTLLSRIEQQILQQVMPEGITAGGRRPRV